MPRPIHIGRRSTAARDSRHQCPISVCTRLLPPSKLMCLDHWRMLPLADQRAVYAAYDHGAGVGSEALAQAQDYAIGTVEAKLAVRAAKAESEAGQ